MTHSPERSFEGIVTEWFETRHGEEQVSTQVYQPAPRWFCDIVVSLDYMTIFIELESRASEIRSGIAQAIGYAAEDPVSGVPMVIVPAGHIDGERVERLRRSSRVVVREFDDERRRFVR